MTDIRRILVGDAIRALEEEIRLRKAQAKSMTLSASRFWEDQKAILTYSAETTVLEDTVAQMRKTFAIR